MKVFLICLLGAIASIASAEYSSYDGKGKDAAGCDPNSCMRRCALAGQGEGTCHGSLCHCAKDVFPKEHTALDCDISWCAPRCAQNDSEGFCESGTCKCRSSGLEVFRNKVLASLDLGEEVVGCDPKFCMHRCKLAGQGDGKCHGPICHCAKDVFPQAFVAEHCEPEKCKNDCTRSGHERGFCVTGKCICL